MKNLKFSLLNLILALILVTSCTNNESAVIEEDLTEDSQSITTTLNRLNNQFDEDGNVTQTDNPTGNVVFDFCFDFVYPLTLSYNNDTTVTVNDLDGLIDIMINSTDELYINGIAFPFDVETYNEATNAIEVETINNEEEFITLLESCEFEDFETCDCFEVYEPVCVEVSDPNGDTFTITYSNACYAECDGFTENDFLESCEDDYNAPGGTECFTLNFPVSIVIDNEETITVSSQEELDNALYNAYYFDFVYPFTVTLEDQTLETINSAEDIEAILEACYGEIDEGNECEECELEPLELVCIEYVDDFGNTVTAAFPNMCFAECAGFTLNNVVDCD